MNKRSVKKVRPVAKASRTVTSRKAPVRKTSARKASARQATKKADVSSQISVPLNIVSTVTVGQTVTVEQVVARASIMRTHKYRVGQTVFYTSSPVSRPGASGSYEVVRLLPSDGDDYQYRIKNPGEAFERVAKESQLELEL
jgi:hypothetical protein